MVVITKNGRRKTISYSAFVNYYQGSGWVVAGEESPASPVNETPVETNDEKEVVTKGNVEEPSVDEDVSEDEWEKVLQDDEVEKPISEMNKDELERKATSLGIIVTGMNNKQMREAIKKAM